MSKLNEDVVTPAGAMKGSLGKSTAEAMEPTTPQGPITYSQFEAAVETPPSKSATAGVPGAVPTATSQGRTGGEKRTELEEDEWVSEQPQGQQPEEQERSTTSQATSTTAQKQGLRASASDFVNKASAKAAVARQYAGGAAERTKEVAREAGGVARVQLHRVVVVGKEKAGIPAEKPVLHAAKEKMGVSPDQPLTEAARQVTRQTVYSARERVYNVSFFFHRKVTTLFLLPFLQAQHCLFAIFTIPLFFSCRYLPGSSILSPRFLQLSKNCILMENA